MKRISREDLDNLIEDSTLLLGKVERPGQLLTSKNEIAKFFYKRKRISTSTFLPQADRFRVNSIRLSQCGVKAPKVNDSFYCEDLPVHIVIYDLIEGIDFREHCSKGELDCLGILPEYLSQLHDTGVYFRAIHLGNIVKCPSGENALIDISDLSVKSGSLSIFRRARNIAHLIDTEEDREYFNAYGLDRFLQAYFEACGCSQLKRRLFMYRFNLALNK